MGAKAKLQALQVLDHLFNNRLRQHNGTKKKIQMLTQGNNRLLKLKRK